MSVNQGHHHTANNNDDNNHGSSFMRSLLVGAVEDRVIEPVANRISWFSTISSVFDLIVPIELTSSWYQHIGKYKRSRFAIGYYIMHNMMMCSERCMFSCSLTLSLSMCQA